MAHRAYENDYPSVTQCLDMLRKPGLEAWFKFNTPQFIKEKSEKGKLIGTQIHEAIHTYIETNQTKVETQYAEEVSNVLKSFMLFRKERPEIILKNAEMALTSEKHKYNGTLDCEAAVDGVPVIGDWKSSEAKKEEKPVIYAEYKYQVAAYVKLFNEVKGADIKDAFIVALAKDKVAYSIYEMQSQEIDDCFNEVFLSALKIISYQKRKDK